MSTIQHEPIAERLDAAYLIGLWLAIHGGDPAPDEAALRVIVGQMIASLAGFAFGPAPALSAEDLNARLASMKPTGGNGGGSAPKRTADFVVKKGDTLEIIIPVPSGDVQVIRIPKATHF